MSPDQDMSIQQITELLITKLGDDTELKHHVGYLETIRREVLLPREERILVAVRHFGDSSIFVPGARQGYAYDIALPLDPVIPASMFSQLKRLEDGSSFFKFSGAGVPAQTTSDTLPGYVCAHGWHQWSPAWLCLTEKGYVFESFVPEPYSGFPEKSNWHERLIAASRILVDAEGSV